GVRPPSRPLSAAEGIALADAEERRAASGGGRAAVVREIVDLVVHGVPIDASFATRALGLRFTPLEQTLDAFDAWARRLGILPNPPEERPHGRHRARAVHP